MTPDKMRDVAEDFVSATERAAAAGFDMLELDMGRGYLLASFLSPLTNRRTDEYGGGPENRMRFPMEVLAVVRAVWPSTRALAVRLNVSDWAPGGLTVDEAIRVASRVAIHGCDLLEVVAGQTVEHDRPQYGRFYLIPYADRVRNEAHIPVLVGGGIATHDEVNTVLAAGRADLCILDLRRR